jgi:hypothetical protein
VAPGSAARPQGRRHAVGNGRTHHIIFSIGFALQKLGYRIINSLVWQKPDPPPNALRTAFTHAHETLLWATKGKGYTFNYDLINSLDPTSQISSVWRIPPSQSARNATDPTRPRSPCGSSGGRWWPPREKVIWSLIRSAGRVRVGWGRRSWGDSLWGGARRRVLRARAAAHKSHSARERAARDL